MRALAEFVMQGRAQASFVAAVSSLVPLVSSAVIALVLLRRGLYDGLIVFMWGLLFALFLIGFYGREGSAVLLLTLAPALTLIIATWAAAVLRLTVSWENAVIVGMIVSLVGGFGVLWACEVHLQNVEDTLRELFLQIHQEQTRQGLDAAALPQAPGKAFIAGAIGYSCALNAIFGLAIGRYWQAQLYNPGGFEVEFHNIRLSIVLSIVLLVPVVYLLNRDFGGSWGNLIALPLIIAGVSLFHWFVKQWQLGQVWLVVFYIALMTLKPFVWLIVASALLDSFFDFRGRFKSIGNGSL